MWTLELRRPSKERGPVRCRSQSRQSRKLIEGIETVNRPVRTAVSVVAILTILGSLGVAAYVIRLQRGAVPYSSPAPTQEFQSSDLDNLHHQRVFFGHQSVGENIIYGLRTLYADDGQQPPTILAISGADELNSMTGSYLAHSRIGQNGDPESKIAHFEQLIRSGVGAKTDAALMKLCYVDFRRTTDPQKLYGLYRATLTGLERDFPDVSFIYTTVPLVSSDSYSSSYVNSLRTQFNSLLRAEAKDKTILDIAALESTNEGGSTFTGDLYGFAYEAMRPEYTTDGGHLNITGAQRVARALVKRVGG